MPKADTDLTPIDPYEGWPLGALEPAIFDLRASVGILGHLITARDEVQIDEWQKCEGDLITAMMRIHDLWGQVWDQRIAEKRAHEEALAALEAKKAAPGSPEDIRTAEVTWTLLRAAAEVAANRCEEAGHPLIGWQRDEGERS
jgi:hypothetical protein